MVAVSHFETQVAQKFHTVRLRRDAFVLLRRLARSRGELPSTELAQLVEREAALAGIPYPTEEQQELESGPQPRRKRVKRKSEFAQKSPKGKTSLRLRRK